MPDEKTQNLTAKKRRCVTALLSTPTVTAAAELVGVSRQTVYEWARDPAFRAALTTAQAEALDMVTAALVGLLSRSLAVLSADLDMGGARASRAALGILSRFADLAQFLDLEARISELERRANEGTTNTDREAGKMGAQADGSG